MTHRLSRPISSLYVSRSSSSLTTTRFILLGIFSLCSALTPAHAQERPFPTIYVYGETDGDRHRQCGVSQQSAVAQVQSTLRNNRVAVSPARGPVHMYVNINPGPLDAGQCFFNVELQFGSYGQTFIESTGDTVFSQTMLCQKASILIWDRATAQSQINSTLAQYVNECLSEFQTLPRPP